MKSYLKAMLNTNRSEQEMGYRTISKNDWGLIIQTTLLVILFIAIVLLLGVEP